MSSPIILAILAYKGQEISNENFGFFPYSQKNKEILYIICPILKTRHFTFQSQERKFGK